MQQPVQPTAIHPVAHPAQGLPPLPPLAQNGRLIPEIAGLGFTLPSASLYPRIVMDISGPEKSGKTFCSLTSTQPVAYLAFDPLNIEGVVQEFIRAGRVILLKPFHVPDALEKADTSAYKRIYDDFRKTLSAVARWPRGTVVIDTGRTVEELVRLSLYGKLKGVGTFSYEQRNMEMESIFDVLAESKLNVVWIHNTQKEWVTPLDAQGLPVLNAQGQTRSVKTNRDVPDRFELIGQRVQVNARTSRDYNPQTGAYGDFRVYLENCRLKSALGGMVFTIPRGSMDFIPRLMADIFDGNNELWGKYV